MKNFKLFNDFILKVLGKPLESTRPVYLTGGQGVEALWPLNEDFRPNIEQIRALPYDASFETAADEAIEARAMGTSWPVVAAGTWRVLLERQQQAIVVAATNERAGNPLMPVPSDLPVSARTGAAMLFLMHGMKLPFPVADRSGMTLPVGSAPASLTRH